MKGYELDFISIESLSSVLYCTALTVATSKKFRSQSDRPLMMKDVVGRRDGQAMRYFFVCRRSKTNEQSSRAPSLLLLLELQLVNVVVITVRTN